MVWAMGESFNCSAESIPYSQTLSKGYQSHLAGFFGLLVSHRPNEELKASPSAYLELWCLHNELFGERLSAPGERLDGKWDEI
jgi:hypothetical protein